MNKIYKLFTIAAISVSTVFSSSDLKAQAVEQGSIAIDVYYGFPNLTGTLAKSLTTSTDISVKSLGPTGGKFEYMLSDKMGIGLESNFTKNTIEYTEFDSFDTSVYAYSTTITVVRIMPRWNIHFGSSDSFDGYFGIAAGYRMAKYDASLKIDGVEDADYTYSASGLNPFAMRIAVGGRYYFTENIGAHMELGIGGGAIIHAGASMKF